MSHHPNTLDYAKPEPRRAGRHWASAVVFILGAVVSGFMALRFLVVGLTLSSPVLGIFCVVSFSLSVASVVLAIRRLLPPRDEPRGFDVLPQDREQR
jgi:hypothetical protein